MLHWKFNLNKIYSVRVPIVSEKQFQVIALSKSGILTTSENQALMKLNFERKEQNNPSTEV